MFSNVSASPLSKVDLWLPVSYQHHYNQLLKAAKMVQSNPDCYELFKGTLSEHRSSLEHPIFIFRCRTERREIISVLVDGNTFQVTNLLEKMHRKKEKQKQQAREDDIRKKQQEQKKYWKICYQQFKKKTRLFGGLKVLTDLPPVPNISNTGMVRYRINFEAKSLQKKTIRYKAMAKANALDKCEIKIKPL
ncbi:hypothetical protein AB835_09595 [Candidatus Endobugula sertula]|uniref:Uncharacterized protein n=1 Tax=Candidatus Endobugula sertula TaxID=62101 RepID=A0A1D2QP71_9GAMM|nr:hypothetical protein AB835_09595 [Candidatus Endobugula sertula]